jgi:hypothetical protein
MREDSYIEDGSFSSSAIVSFDPSHKVDLHHTRTFLVEADATFVLRYG